jgi:protein phosphatase PTC1
MFGGSSSSGGTKSETSSISEAAGNTQREKVSGTSPSPDKDKDKDAGDGSSPTPVKPSDQATSGEKRSGHGSSPNAGSSAEQKKRRSSGVSGKASNLIAQAKNTLFTQVGSRSNSDLGADSKTSDQTPLQKLGKQDQALAVPQGQHNNAAGESLPGPRSTFRVGVWEDRNKKCRRTMEDTHAFLYNFLHTPAPAVGAEVGAQVQPKPATDAGEGEADDPAEQDMIETDNGYFAIFDGHAGTFAADWCGKKLHLILEEIIRKNPNAPIPELLDQTFTAVDAQLEKLPLKNSGCTAAIAVLRWEDRVPSSLSATGSQAIAPALARAAEEASKAEEASASLAAPDAAHAKLKSTATRQRVLYTANVGDARIILCRQGKALRLSYDHKGSDENEGKRITNAGGLILNNRVNGVLAVTRALGDTYMKDLVTGHPYTTETVIQPDLDEFIIIACDGVSENSPSHQRPAHIDHKEHTDKLCFKPALGRLLGPRCRRPRALRAGPRRRCQVARRPRAVALQHRQPVVHDRAPRPPGPARAADQQGARHRRRGRRRFHPRRCCRCRRRRRERPRPRGQ